MSDAWDGRPQNRERDGWHWLQYGSDRPAPTPWIAEIGAWANGPAYSPQGIVELGYHYLGPCHTPAEVAVMVKAQVEDALLHTLHPEFGSIYDADGEVTKAVEPLQAEIERLRGERDRLRTGLMRVLQYENKCDQTGKPCDVARGCPCACSLEAETWCEGGGT
jgi:hypothetical protein